MTSGHIYSALNAFCHGNCDSYGYGYLAYFQGFMMEISSKPFKRRVWKVFHANSYSDHGFHKVSEPEFFFNVHNP